MLYEVFDQYNLQVFSDVRLVVKSNKKGECVCHRSGFQHLSCNVKWANQVNAKGYCAAYCKYSSKVWTGCYTNCPPYFVTAFITTVFFQWNSVCMTLNYFILVNSYLLFEKKIWVQNNIKVCDNYKHTIWHPLMIWAFALHMLKHGHNFC